MKIPAAINDANTKDVNVVDKPVPAPANEAVTHTAKRSKTHTLTNLLASCSGDPSSLMKDARKLKNKAPKLAKKGPTHRMKVL